MLQTTSEMYAVATFAAFARAGRAVTTGHAFTAAANAVTLELAMAEVLTAAVALSCNDNN